MVCRYTLYVPLVVFLYKGSWKGWGWGWGWGQKPKITDRRGLRFRVWGAALIMAPVRMIWKPR